MLTERCLQSEALGKQAQDFIAWSMAAGNDLRRMRNMSLEKAHDFAAESPQFRAFPLEKIRVLHPRDRYHYPAVLFARNHTGTETHIQSFNLITGAKQRYAFIVQSEKSGAAVSASIIRHLPQVPSGITINFGKRLDLPNYTGNHSTDGVQIDLSGQVYAIAPESWGKDTIVDWVKSTLHHLTHGISMHRMPHVQELSRLGAKYADPNDGGSLSALFSEHPTYLG
ncbi:hypothetical protein HZB58_05105 [Candidatus Gottesmanbacteria bacterium]|nr:hypothetical protein [Candidatus Gottesmanbacteria bacterium]